MTTALPDTCNVAIVGAGPSGLAAALQLKRLGVNDVIVLEREPEAGGIPRHCGHIAFGMREYRRLLTGPAYASRLVTEVQKAGVRVQCNTSVVRLNADGQLIFSTPDGLGQLNAQRVILATGVRETPRAARLVSGQRPLGIITTGALQSMVYLQNRIPFRRPVIVGSELVSFSALLTCRHARIKPVAMIEAGERITARSFSRLLPLMLGVPIRLNTHIAAIFGHSRVNAVHLLDAQGKEYRLACDGVVFSGQFTPEATLLRLGHLSVDTASGGPIIDQYGRCSDPNYFATGNLLRPVETAGWCWQEGRHTASYVAASLENTLPQSKERLALACHGDIIRYAIPQHITLPYNDLGMRHIQLRFARSAKGCLYVSSGEDKLYSKKMTALPERRVLVALDRLVGGARDQTMVIGFD